jgi:hypothetical protein
MGKLTDLISELRGRRENPDRTRVILFIFFDPVTKAECTDLPAYSKSDWQPRSAARDRRIGRSFRSQGERCS